MSEPTGSRSRADQSRSLDPFERRERGRYAVVMVSRPNPLRLDGGDIPFVAEVERRSELFLTGRASIGSIVIEAHPYSLECASVETA